MFQCFTLITGEVYIAQLMLLGNFIYAILFPLLPW